jgi:hypothetical protein
MARRRADNAGLRADRAHRWPMGLRSVAGRLIDHLHTPHFHL